MKKLITITIILVLMPLFFVCAQEKVDYKDSPVIDSDLDGLTDEGERQIFGTDPEKTDTDRDGFYDGTEILSGTNPLDVSDTSIDFSGKLSDETSWAWYISRSAGLLAFIFLWLTVFLGLSMRNPLIKKIIEEVYSFEFHCFVAALSVFWALVHGTSFLFDKALGFSVYDIAIPYFSKTALVNTNYLALGIMAFYAMVIMTITSYLRSHLNHRFWRVLHFLNPLAFIFVVIHGYMNGTDMKNIFVGGAFLILSGLLVLIYLTSLGAVIWNKYKTPRVEEAVK